ncbi:preprotein translocase subunit SecE [Candidatus Parcubacteria bacterium]|jgi:preprotein translocase subunit SecE|nr:preprotein translocase subunit SecE [Candidatus Parcubacteria bacterium]MBT3949039.1 preprotein translocase subunit SecE [Candidatus Parcubacteria bacterium]
MNKLIKYIRESIGELKKVTWPTKKQTTTYTIVVVAMSIGVAIFFAILDWFFNLGLGIII